MTNPLKYLDQKVQKFYTRIGQHIPEDKLYKIITPLSFISTITSAFCISLQYNLPIGMGVDVLGSYETAGNIFGILKGEGNKRIEGESRALTRDELAYETINKNLRNYRLPTFITSLGFAARAGIDVYNHFANGQPLPGTFSHDVSIALGLFGIASSMYLKDQDPRLLKKKPSRIKALGRLLRQKAKKAIASIPPVEIPNPFPNPAPVSSYSSEALR